MKITGAIYKGGTLLLKVIDPDALRFAREFTEGNYEIVKQKKRRSLDANAYLWKLCDELAKAMRTTKEDEYRRAIREVGVFTDITIPADEAEKVKRFWNGQGIGSFTEDIDGWDSAGIHFDCFRAYYGSSTYDTKQMSRLIDFIKQDCEAIGIETDDGRIASLLADWEKHHG